MAIEPGKSVLEVDELMQILPHRFPMLMIDRLIDIKPGDSAVAVKNVSYNEQFFQGHFPQKPIMPGVPMIEAMARRRRRSRRIRRTSIPRARSSCSWASTKRDSESR